MFGGVNIVSNFQLPSSNGLGVMIFEDLEEKDELVTELMSDEAVCRTAPATPGLLNIQGVASCLEPKNPAYGRHQLSLPIRIVGPI